MILDYLQKINESQRDTFPRGVVSSAEFPHIQYGTRSKIIVPAIKYRAL